MCRLRRIPNTARPVSIKTSALNLVLCIPIQNAIKKAAFLSELPTMLYQQQTTNSTRQEIIWIYWHHNTFKLETYLLSKVRFHPIENERLWEKMCNWWHLNRLRRSPLAGLWQDAFEVEGIQHSSSVRQLNSCSGLNGFCFYSSAL